MPHHPDPGDERRRVYLQAVLGRMAGSVEEEHRIREAARGLLARKRRDGLAGTDHLARWDELLGLPVPELAHRLLADGPDGREMRHAHMFAGVLPAREANALMAGVAPSGVKAR